MYLKTENPQDADTSKTEWLGKSEDEKRGPTELSVTNSVQFNFPGLYFIKRHYLSVCGLHHGCFVCIGVCVSVCVW